ncbi:MAG: phage portal protein [Candidatus Omnitrophica bacterium]|nr:phage portal protein [Candidatus Omnitrophota bacterium]
MDVSNSVVGTLNTNSYTDPTANTTDFYNSQSSKIDGVTGEESSHTPDFNKWHGYYEEVSIFGALVDILASWTVGKGFKGQEKEINKIKNIKGWGKDDINSIFENQLRTALICGDSFAEIIKDKAGRITNLKPINPGTIKIIVNDNGILDRYEQYITISGQKKMVNKFEPKQIFHLCWNRLADEIHGKSLAKRAEPIIKQIKQLQEDLGIRFHRIVRPLRLFVANTDDTTTLTEVEAKLNSSYKNCEIIVIPDKTLEEKDGAAIPSAVDAIQYLNNLLRNFVSACNCPEVIIGWSEGTTDASAKIVYLAFQQPTERKQKFMEEQIRLQLGIEINFEFPASLEPVTETAGDMPTNELPKNNPPESDEKKAGKLNNIMKK